MHDLDICISLGFRLCSPSDECALQSSPSHVTPPLGGGQPVQEHICGTHLLQEALVLRAPIPGRLGAVAEVVAASLYQDDLRRTQAMSAGCTRQS